MRVLLLALPMLLLLVGCRFSEALTSTSVVIDGELEIPKAAYLSGPVGFDVQAVVVVEALGGTVDDRGGVVFIHLGGKTIVTTTQVPDDVSYDVHIDTGVLRIIRNEGKVWIYTGQ